MTVETNANFISDLNKAYPRNRDLIKEGDDHIRLVKSVMQNTFPGMDGALTAGSEKLNKLDATFTYEEDTLKINNSVELKKDGTVECNGSVFTNAGDPKEGGDLVTLKFLQGSAMWPVGSIFMTVDSRDPKVILGFGTWEKFAAGRVIVGTGTTTDASNETRTVVNEAKGGSYAVKLSEGNLTEHRHPIAADALMLKEGGDHKHNFCADDNIDGAPIAADGIERVKDYHRGGADGSGSMWMYRTSSSGPHKHGHESGFTDSVGKGEAFDIIPPFMACNIWVRKVDA